MLAFSERIPTRKRLPHLTEYEHSKAFCRHAHSADAPTQCRPMLKEATATLV